MSSSFIPIPPREQDESTSTNSCYSSSSSSSSDPAGSQPTPYSAPPTSSKGKAPVRDLTPERSAPRRTSLLGDSLSKAEHKVIDLGGDDTPPRLVTCVKSSQGFDWNQDLFLPSYASDYNAQKHEHQQDPVHDIVLSDEDVDAIMPQ